MSDTGAREDQDSYEDDPLERQHQREALELREAILDAEIGAIESPPAISVPPTMSIRDACRLMIDKRIGALLIAEGDHIVGIFTERDVLSRVVVSSVAHDAAISTVMTKNPEALGEHDGIAFALNRMIVRGFRHLPIVDAAGHPRGVLSVRGVVGYIVSVLPGRVLNLAPEPHLGIPRSTDGG